MGRKIRKAVFPVGGLGTRFLPATKAMPKEMLPVVDTPLIQYAVDEARAAGIEEMIFVTSRGKSLLEDHFDRSPELEATLSARGKHDLLEILRVTNLGEGGLAATRQPEPLGLGHAVWCAEKLIGDEPFAVLLPDDLVLSDRPCLAQMIEAYDRVGGSLVAVMDVPREHTKRYGIVDPKHDHDGLVAVRGVVEKPTPEAAPSTLAIIGRYILDPAVFGHLARQQRGAGGEIQLTDALARLIGEQPFHGVRFEGRRFDCGDKLGFIEANIAFGLARGDLGSDVARLVKSYATNLG